MSGVGIMNYGERSDKYKEIIEEYVYMKTMLSQISMVISEEEYKRIKKLIDENYLKKIALYIPYQDFISSKKILVSV